MQLGIRDDVVNSIFMLNAYPQADNFGVLLYPQITDFSVSATGMGATSIAPQQMIPGGAQPAPQPSMMPWILGGLALIAIVYFATR